MPPKRKEDVFTWTDDEAALLLSITADYRAQKLSEGVDWESVQAKYCDIARRMIEYLRKHHEIGGTDKDYPHQTDEITKERVATKLKAVRLKYRAAVDSGRRSGHGRVILLYFEECEQIWGGSPATKRLQNGIDSSNINLDDSCKESIGIPFNEGNSEDSDPELEVSASTSSTSTSIGSLDVDSTERVSKRRALLDDALKNHKKRKLQKKVSMDRQLLSLAKEELELKKEMLKQQREIDDDYKNSMRTLSGVMESLGRSIAEGFQSLRYIQQQTPFQNYSNWVQQNPYASQLIADNFQRPGSSFCGNDKEPEADF